MKKLKNIKIEESVYNKMKKHCEKNGLKIYSWVAKIILEKLTQEKENDNLQNDKFNK
jgi:hypothetical protein